MSLPPNIQANDCVILFDGVCKLCNKWSLFIVKHDVNRDFKLCSVQSTEGQQILKHFGLATDNFDTMLYVEGAISYDKSDAFFKIMAKLGFPWRLFTLGVICPKVIRNWLYDRIALNRYRMFGKYDACILPSKDIEDRFLTTKD